MLAALGERDETAEICRDRDGNPEPDADLRDTETVPLKESIEAYFKREVLPHVPDAWIDDEQDQGRLRDPAQPPLLPLRAAAPAGSDRGRHQDAGAGDHGPARRRDRQQRSHVMIGASFDSTKTPLQELLARADSGKLQLPDFQRGWVWDDDRIRACWRACRSRSRSALSCCSRPAASTSASSPARSPGTHERLRTVAPETLILDGQQRLTSLYQALMSQTVSRPRTPRTSRSAAGTTST